MDIEAFIKCVILANKIYNENKDYIESLTDEERNKFFYEIGKSEREKFLDEERENKPKRRKFEK